MPKRTPSLILALAASVAVVLAGTPLTASADYDGWGATSDTIHTATDADFAARDASLAEIGDREFVEVWISPPQDAFAPRAVLAKAGGPDGWGPLETVYTPAAGESNTAVEVFATPAGAAVAVWRSSTDTVRLRASVRSGDGEWSAPVELGSGLIQLRRVFPTDGGAVVVWTANNGQGVWSRAWSGGAWQPTQSGTGSFPATGDTIEFAARPDGQVSVVVARDGGLFVSTLAAGGGWSAPERERPELEQCETDVGVKDANGDIRALVTLCYSSTVTGQPGATYTPDGDLDLWWSAYKGMQYVDGVYPAYSVRCDCAHGADGITLVDADVDEKQLGPWVQGTPRLYDGRGIHKTWNEEGEVTIFIGGLGDDHETVNVYREGSAFADPDATFEAPGGSSSDGTSYVAATFVDGDDILVAPGGSCTARVLDGDDRLSDVAGLCVGDNRTNWTAVRSDDGTVSLASTSVRSVYFDRFASTGAVVKATPKKPAIDIVKKPTSKKGGRAEVTVRAPAAGDPTPTGTVKLTMKKDGSTKSVTGALGGKGVAKVDLPKLTKGTWTFTAQYRGDACYEARASDPKKLTVKQ